MTNQLKSIWEAGARAMCEAYGRNPDEIFNGQPRWMRYEFEAQDIWAKEQALITMSIHAEGLAADALAKAGYRDVPEAAVGVAEAK